MASNFSSESETDFWVELEAQHAITKQGNKFFARLRKKKQEPFDQITTQYANSLSVYQRQKFQMLIDRIRDSSKLEYENTLNISIQKLHQSYRRKIHQLSQQHLRMLDDLRKDYDALKLLLTKKDFQIQGLQKYISEQESFIATQRIIKENIAKPPPQPKQTVEMILKKQKKSLKYKIDGFRDIVTMYHDQADSAKMELTIVEQKLQRREKEFLEELDALDKHHQKIETDLQERIKRIQELFDNFKQETGKELEVYSMASQRQVQIISTLQYQLRSAKIVLKTPRLKEKLREKIRTQSVPTKPKPSTAQDRKIVAFQRKYMDRGSKNWNPNSKRGATAEPGSTRATNGMSATTDMGRNTKSKIK